MKILLLKRTSSVTVASVETLNRDHGIILSALVRRKKQWTEASACSRSWGSCRAEMASATASARVGRCLAPGRCFGAWSTTRSAMGGQAPGHALLRIGEATVGRPLTCQHCSLSFPDEARLGRHVRMHSYDRPFRCQFCAVSCLTRQHLVHHERTHTGERPYKCPYCPNAFSSKTNLTRHVRSHTGERPYRCHRCSIAFTQKTHLITHSRIHTGERPHRCNRCSCAFSLKCALLRHMKTHQGE